MLNKMDVKLLLIFLIVLSLDFSCGQRAHKHRKKPWKKDRTAVMPNVMKEMKKEIEELKKQVSSLPQNVVQIHMHDGNVEEEHGQTDVHHQHDNSSEVEEDMNTSRLSNIESTNDQHIHMHMHLESSDCHHHRHHKDKEEIHAHCEVVPNSNIQDGDDIRGRIHMIQKGDGPVDVDIKMSGFDMTKDDAQMSHGFHVHTFGDLTNSCDSLGPHYNPDETTHGAPDAHTRHVGDLGNIGCDMNGEVDHHMTDDQISLHGKESLIGRSIAIHHGPDDMGLGGDAGA